MEFDGSTCELEISEVMESADKHLVRWRSSDFEVMVEDRCTGGLRLVEEGNTETKSDKMMMVEDRNIGEPVREGFKNPSHGICPLGGYPPPSLPA